MLAKTNQAVATLETYRNRLEQVSSRLTALEFQSAAMLDDVLVVLQRAEMTTRMVEEIERNVIELGVEGRLIKIQLDEMTEWRAARQARPDPRLRGDRGDGPRRAPRCTRWRELTTGGCSSSTELAQVLGLPGAVNPMDHAVSPRGFRVLSQDPAPARGRGRARDRALRRPGGVRPGVGRRAGAGRGRGAVRAREIREGLRRLQEQNLVDRYLNL